MGWAAFVVMACTALILNTLQSRNITQDTRKKNKWSTKHHAILIPYRDRAYHLKTFRHYMNYYLSPEHFPSSTFSLWIIEQDDLEPFNRGWLANVGLTEIFAASQVTCVVFHDVDVLPDPPLGKTSLVPYDECAVPTRLGNRYEQFNWGLPYATFSGCVVSMNRSAWRMVNGMSNDYVGWGGEDDDLYNRLRVNGLLVSKGHGEGIHQPPDGKGTFRVISQDKKHHKFQILEPTAHKRNIDLLNLWETNSTRWKGDGLSNLYYKVTHRVTHHTPNLGFQTIHRIKVQQSLDRLTYD